MKSPHLALVASVVVCLAACGTASAPGSPSARDAATTVDSAGATTGATVGIRRVPGGFASLPDRGTVAAFDATRMPRQSGDFRWQPVRVSEAHALAAVGGVLRLPTPEGAQVALRYQRHVEHPDGNWTWVGRGTSGEDAVITFGDDAVFGSVHQGGRTLRLVTDRNGAWIVSTPPGADVEAWREGGDALIPPPPAKDAGGPVMAGAERITAAATAQSEIVVDLVVGYTVGFAADRGGDSAARTRVNNLVEVTNQAYANSQLAARVRLVHAMSVNFPDATTNDSALRTLTGHNVAVDPALQPLRQAREDYRGDLVVLLRDFQTPQNEGCGVAWLLGAGGTTISASSQGYGYSVVADGSDLDEGDGKTYGCREETFAHELGHNMGQAHNVEDASNAGAHPYSYGYRHPATDAFYTVMAYRIPDSRQFPIRYFANPQVGYQNAGSIYNGAPTGVPNTSDNVASMRQTMAAVAQFRLALAPAPAPVPARLMDFNGDGHADIFWRNTTLQQADWWLMKGASRVGVASMGVAAQYRVAAIADFSGDGRSDVLWEDGATLWLWRAEAAGGFSVHFIDQYPAAGWTIAGAGDLNGDGKADIVWSNRTLQQADWWLMNGPVRIGVGSKAVASQYRIAGIGDFSGDGRADILWVDAGSMWLWRSESGGGMTVLGIGAYPAGDWTIAGIGDFDGNGRADIFWNSKALNRSDWWYMDGAVRVATNGATVDARYSVAAVADYTGDGRADVLWQDGQTLWIWRAEANGGFSVHFVDQYPQGGWTIAR